MSKASVNEQQKMRLIKFLGIDERSVEQVYLSDWTEKDSFFIFTGRGLSNVNMHLGHYYLYSTIANISRKNDIPVVFQISNDEKRDYQVDSYADVLIKTKKFLTAIRSIDWNPRILKVFHNLDPLNAVVLKHVGDRLSSTISMKKVTSVFGAISLQKATYISNQLAPLVVCSTIHKGRTPLIITVQDQLGFFFLYRDVCKKLKLPSPTIVLIRSIKDSILNQKMSSSTPRRCIDTSELDKIIKTKSGSTADDDFCIALIDKLSHVLDAEARTQIRSIVVKFQAHRSSLKLKKETIDLMKRLLRSKCKVATSQLYDPRSSDLIAQKSKRWSVKSIHHYISILENQIYEKKEDERADVKKSG